MSNINTPVILIAAALAYAGLAVANTANTDPRAERHELMEDVGDAAKPVGQMLRGDAEYDAGVLMTSLETFKAVSEKFGDLFPPGSETGGGTEAAPAIWEDRAGFEQALADWREATVAAIDAHPQSLDEARPIVGPVFNTCKSCHDGYRIEDE